MPDDLTVRGPQASRLAARVDIGILVDERVSAQPVPLQMIRPHEVSWERNAPSIADTFSVTFDAAFIPVDLAVLRGAILDGWLFEHGEPDRCQPGDVGYFSGIIDEVSRSRQSNSVSVSGRDWTSLPMRHKLTAADLALIRWDASPELWQIVDILISFMPGGEAWRVESLDDSGARSVLDVLGSRPRLVQPLGLQPLGLLAWLSRLRHGLSGGHSRSGGH